MVLDFWFKVFALSDFQVTKQNELFMLTIGQPASLSPPRLLVFSLFHQIAQFLFFSIFLIHFFLLHFRERFQQMCKLSLKDQSFLP